MYRPMCRAYCAQKQMTIHQALFVIKSYIWERKGVLINPNPNNKELFEKAIAIASAYFNNEGTISFS